MIGRHPDIGLAFSLLYSAINSWFMRILSSPYCSRRRIISGCSFFILLIAR